jgi:CARDB
MKKLLTTMLTGVACIAALAQNPQLPAGSKPGQLPLPALKPLQPADLVITDISIVEAVYDINWKVKISVTVKNQGQLIAAKTIIKAQAQKTTPANSPWKDFGYTVAIIPLKPKESVTKEFLFIDHGNEMYKLRQFNLKLTADSRNEVTESNETNNASSVLAISSSR